MNLLFLFYEVKKSKKFVKWTFNNIISILWSSRGKKLVIIYIGIKALDPFNLNLLVSFQNVQVQVLWTEKVNSKCISMLLSTSENWQSKNIWCSL